MRFFIVFCFLRFYLFFCFFQMMRKERRKREKGKRKRENKPTMLTKTLMWEVYQSPWRGVLVVKIDNLVSSYTFHLVNYLLCILPESSNWRATAKISTPRAGLWMPNVNVLPSRNLWLIFKDLSMQRHENHQNNIGINNVEIDLAVFKSVYYKCAECSSPSDIYFPHFSIRNQPLSCHSFFIYKDYDATL